MTTNSVLLNLAVFSMSACTLMETSTSTSELYDLDPTPGGAETTNTSVDEPASEKPMGATLTPPDNDNTGVEETASEKTGSEDTGVEETSTEETGTDDTGVEDTEVGCVPAPVDFGEEDTSLWIDASEASYANGAFVQLSAFRWVENNDTGSWSYTEGIRDEWSVYMTADDGRPGRFVLDFFSEQVSLNGTLLVEMVPTRKAIDGYSGNRALYSTGAFAQLDLETWVQNGTDGLHIYDEDMRDEWSVWLTERGNSNVIVILDYFQMKVFYTDTGDIVDLYELYPIDEARPQSITGWVAREVHVGEKRYTQEGPTLWTLYSGDDCENYTETSRDEALVFLEPISDPGAILELNLSQGEVVYYPVDGTSVVEGTITTAW